MENEKPKTLDCWGVVELMGHQRMAGLPSPQPMPNEEHF